MRHFPDLIQDLLHARIPPGGVIANKQAAAPAPRETRKIRQCPSVWLKAPSVSPACTDGVPDVIREAIEDGIKHMQRAKERYPHVSDK